MDLSDPASVALAPSTRAVLRTLAGTTQPLTGRDVGRLSGLSQNGAHKVLVQLVEHGLVHAEPAGQAVLHTLNRRHLLVTALLDMLTARQQLSSRLATAVSGWPVPAVHVSMFGSAARGDGGPTSDIDMLVVRPDSVDIDDTAWRQQLAEAATDVEAWTGNRLSWLELSQSEVAAASAEGEAIVTEWRRDAVPLAGVPLEDLLRAVRR